MGRSVEVEVGGIVARITTLMENKGGEARAGMDKRGLGGDKSGEDPVSPHDL